jgi:uncharacterized membrane protein
MLLAGGYGILIALFIALFPKAPDPSANVQVKFADVKQLIDTKCAVCHAARPSFAGFAAPPKNVMLETPAQIKTMAQAIHQQTVVTRAMPIGNLTNITDAERALIANWYQGGAKTE